MIEKKKYWFIVVQFLDVYSLLLLEEHNAAQFLDHGNIAGEFNPNLR